ncbi:MAG: transketolase [Magnetococcales bacterium]|nr:transketolase [Magnetococcales bacterium]
MRKSCLTAIHELAKQDERVLFIGSDLGVGTAESFQQQFPERYFMEGIAEQNLIGMAAGLAMEGYVPYVNTIASFLTRRCLEQITIDLCLHNLPVRLIGNGGGLVYAPLGPTHLAPDDFSLMRAQPNMTVIAPCDAVQMHAIMAQTLSWPGPIYIRLAKGGDPILFSEETPLQIGRAVPLREGRHALLITTGAMAHRGVSAAEMLAKKGLDCAVWHLHTIKPLDQEALLHAAVDYPLIVTLEEHALTGGLGSAVIECLVDHGPFPGPRLLRLGLKEAFSEHYGSQDALLEAAGLQPPAIAKSVVTALFGA